MCLSDLTLRRRVRLSLGSRLRFDGVLLSLIKFIKAPPSLGTLRSSSVVMTPEKKTKEM